MKDVGRGEKERGADGRMEGQKGEKGGDLSTASLLY